MTNNAYQLNESPPPPPKIEKLPIPVGPRTGSEESTFANDSTLELHGKKLLASCRPDLWHFVPAELKDRTRWLNYDRATKRPLDRWEEESDWLLFADAASRVTDK
jgi:hypothetical protein